MSINSKAAASNDLNQARRLKPVRVFTYPKFVFLYPTLIMAIVCWIGMLVNGNETVRPSNIPSAPASAPAANVDPKTPPNPLTVQSFRSPQNMLAMLFLGFFALNMIIVTFDFPRFTILAAALLGTTVLFLFLWLGLITDILTPLFRLFDGIYMAANAGFYLAFALIMAIIYGGVMVTRWLDYWEFMPNEILHHHGPWSDLERFPTMQLKFDKEIPDVFEHLLLGSGRLVFHVQGEQKSITLDNVLWINHIETVLKNTMSRLEVRVTTDQEAAQP